MLYQTPSKQLVHAKRRSSRQSLGETKAPSSYSRQGIPASEKTVLLRFLKWNLNRNKQFRTATILNGVPPLMTNDGGFRPQTEEEVRDVVVEELKYNPLQEPPPDSTKFTVL